MDHRMDKRITPLANNFYTYEDKHCLSSPNVKNASNNIYKDYVVVPIDFGPISLVLKDHLLVIAKELGLNINSSADTHSKISNLSANHMVHKYVSYPKTKFCICEIPVENHRLPGMYWMSKIHKFPPGMYWMSKIHKFPSGLNS